LALKKINNFIKYEEDRHKEVVPDLGVFLVLFTLFSSEIHIEDFIDALLDENFIRCVMWWRDKVSNNDSK